MQPVEHGMFVPLDWLVFFPWESFPIAPHIRLFFSVGMPLWLCGWWPGHLESCKGRARRGRPLTEHATVVQEAQVVCDYTCHYLSEPRSLLIPPLLQTIETTYGILWLEEHGRSLITALCAMLISAAVQMGSSFLYMAICLERISPEAA